MEIIEFLEARMWQDEIEAHSMECGCDLSLDGTHAAVCPVRVLAQCAAFRRIVENHERHRPGESGYGASRHAVRLIASIWSDHPDFHPDWA